MGGLTRCWMARGRIQLEQVTEWSAEQEEV